MKDLYIIVYILISSIIYAPWVQAEEVPLLDKEAYIASANTQQTLTLGMVDCIKMVLESNSEIRLKRITPLIEDANVRIAGAAFEPDLSFDFSMEDNTEPSSITLTGTGPIETKTKLFNFGYDEKFITGTNVSLDFNNTRTHSNSRLQSFNPQYSSEAKVTITQPLFKGFGLLVNKADFLIASNNRLKSKQDLAQEIMKVLTDAKKGYYDLLYQQMQYKVAELSFDRMQDLHNVNTQRYAKGLASDVDLLQSEAEIALSKEALLAAESALKLSEDNLKLITNLVDNPQVWNARIVLIDEPQYEKEEIDLAEAINKAFEYRPDYESAKIDLRNKDIAVAFDKNGMLPTIDLVGSYGLNGLDSAYDKAVEQIGDANYEDWAVGVNVKVPFGADGEIAKYTKSKLQKKQALINFQRMEQKIILEVRDAVRNIDISYKMVDAALKSKEAQEKQYNAQQQRFKAGLVSTHDIIDYHEKLAASQTSYIKSLIDYNMAIIELARVQGTTLADEHITIE